MKTLCCCAVVCFPWRCRTKVTRRGPTSSLYTQGDDTIPVVNLPDRRYRRTQQCDREEPQSTTGLRLQCDQKSIPMRVLQPVKVRGDECKNGEDGQRA